MSAFIVSHDHIDALLTFALDDLRHGHVYYLAEHRRVPIFRENATEVGRILLDENERSVRARYPDDAPDNLPGSIGERADSYVFRPWMMTPPAVAILKGCACYDYQACETEDYEQSIACAIIDAIRKRALARIPGYDAADGWDFRRPQHEPVLIKLTDLIPRRRS